MKPLPTGLQEFEYLRKTDALYVDKTDKLYNLVSGIKKQFFLSRPRRFGKTLLCWTLNALFKGKKELFEDLAISKTDWNWDSYPVIHLDMSKGGYSQGASMAQNAIQFALKSNAEDLGIELNLEASLPTQLELLIKDSVKKYGKQAVLLIDEYDNPMLSVIDNQEDQTNRDSMLANLLIYLYKGDITSAIELAIKPFMAEIPNNLAIRQEKYFQTIFHIIFNMLGVRCNSEVSIATGRIDSIVETPKFVYCFEFKLDGTAEEALEQIDSKEYLTPYTNTGKTLFKIGVSFDYEQRKIKEWKYI